MRQKLLVSIRGKIEARDAFYGGAHIIDVEYPASALGTPYPLNILTVRKALPKAEIATYIGEEQTNRSTSCQAALGVALAGADDIKFGLAKYCYKDAKYLGKNIVRTIKQWFPRKKTIPAIFADRDLSQIFDPIKEGPKLAREIKADGVLIDTFDKSKHTLLNLLSVEDIAHFVNECHSYGIEAWIAGSVNTKELPVLWQTGVDVICVRGAACLSGPGRMGKVSKKLVNELADTIPN